ncbi:MAG: putative paraquat-inducible protein A [Candidatus Woesearchaeota archaeon]|jgi:uncharacterized paraquat-inducible protein A
MASIPGLVFIIIGIAIAAISSFNKELQFFFYVGVVLFAYGFLKILFIWIKKPKQKKHMQTHPTHNQQQPPAAQQQHANGHRQCLNCGKTVHATFRFCPHCGYGV